MTKKTYLIENKYKRSYYDCLQVWIQIYPPTCDIRFKQTSQVRVRSHTQCGSVFSPITNLADTIHWVT